jgi:DNA repair ATPase RecN
MEGSDKEDDEEEMDEARKYTPPTKAEIEADKRKDQRGKSRPSMSAKSANKSVYKGMMGKLKEEAEELEEAKFTDKQIKQAYGIINDPRWKSGNMTHIVNTIEKIARGLSKHPGVQKALKATNESTAAYAKSQEKIANDKKKANIKPGELNKLAKIRAMLDKEKKK